MDHQKGEQNYKSTLWTDHLVNKNVHQNRRIPKLMENLSKKMDESPKTANKIISPKMDR